MHRYVQARTRSYRQSRTYQISKYPDYDYNDDAGAVHPSPNTLFNNDSIATTRVNLHLPSSVWLVLVLVFVFPYDD
jgi:hypothetical protein